MNRRTRSTTGAGRRPRFALALAAVVPAALVTIPALPAQMNDRRVEITVGSFSPTFDTAIRLDSAQLGSGTDLHLERDFLLEDQPREVWAEVAIRFSGRNRLVIDRVGFDRSGANSLAHQVQFGDVVYGADVELAARLESRHTSASWRFSVVRGPTSEIALSLGASWIDIEASVSGVASATASGQPAGTTVIAESGRASGPVPLAGVHGRWWLTQRLRLGADGRYFDVSEFEGWNGSIVELSARLDWFLSGNFALGLGWASASIQADFEDSDDLGSIDYTFDGPRAMVTLAF